MKLSKRLSAIADMVTPGSIVCDVGTDHAFLPIELIKSGKIPSAIAMDINKGPLERAVRHIKTNNLEKQIECRISDGLDELEKGEADCAVIAGMGGDLISAILFRCPDKVDELVLSPHTHYETVRKALYELCYTIIAENMIIEDDKFYLIIKAIKTEKCNNNTDSVKYNYFGEYLIKQKNRVLLQYLKREEEKYRTIPQKSDYLLIVRDAIREIKDD